MESDEISAKGCGTCLQDQKVRGEVLFTVESCTYLRTVNLLALGQTLGTSSVGFRTILMFLMIVFIAEYGPGQSNLPNTLVEVRRLIIWHSLSAWLDRGHRMVRADIMLISPGGLLKQCDRYVLVKLVKR